MASISTGATVAAGDTIVASAMNTRFSDIESWANGNPNLSNASGTTTIEGALSVSGTLSVTAATTTTNTLSVGVSGTGHDVKFWGDTAGDYLEWDADTNKLNIVGTNGTTALNVSDGNVTIADDLDVDGTTNLDVVDIDGAVDMASTLTIADGSVSAPSIRFSGGSGNDGIYGLGGNNVSFAIDGVQAMYTIKAPSSSNVSIAIGEWTGSVGSNKEIYRDSTFGTLYTSSSKRALKDNIQSVSGSGAIVDALNPVTFIAAPAEGETEGQKAWRERDLIYGFVAEEVAEIADGKLALYDVDGESLVPSNWKTRDMVAVLAAELKSVRQRLVALEA